MSEYAGAINAGASLVGSGTKAYGAYAAGRQAEDYYGVQSALTMRSKAEADRNIQIKVREANLMRDQADDALMEANWKRQLGKVKEREYRKETDRGVSAIYAKTAKSGVSMAYGSPMDVIEDVATERAKAYDILEWGNEAEHYRGKQAARQIREKSTIMLDEAMVARSNLSMFDYQASLYRQAGSQATSTAQIQMATSFMNALQDVFTIGEKYDWWPEEVKET